MAKSRNATPKADIDPNFEDQIRTLRDQAKAEHDARIKGNQTAWMVPKEGEWDGDLFDREGMAKAFQRDKANEDFTSATSDPLAPGVTEKATAKLPVAAPIVTFAPVASQVRVSLAMLQMIFAPLVTSTKLPTTGAP